MRERKKKKSAPKECIKKKKRNKRNKRNKIYWNLKMRKKKDKIHKPRGRISAPRGGGVLGKGGYARPIAVWPDAPCLAP